MTTCRTSIVQITRDLRQGWKQLALTDVFCKIIAFILLTPLVGILFRLLLAVSGNTVLADQDILFFIGPMGWICCILIGGLWLGIVALEQAVLMAVLCANQQQRKIHLVTALRFAAINAWPTLRVTGRIVLFSLLAVTPFLAVAGITYLTLLSEYDINYYLQQKPPEFLIALGIGGVVVAGMVAVLLRLFTGWFFALPLVLFEQVSPARALRVSADRAQGRRRGLMLWICGWALVSTVVSGVATSVVVGLGHLLVPRSAGSIWLLSVAIGITLFVSTVVNLAVNLLSTTSFAAILFNWYRDVTPGREIDFAQLELRDQNVEASRFPLTRTGLIAFSVVGVIVATGVGVSIMLSVRLEDNVEVIAHRGASKKAPENTMAAVEQAIADKADWIEIDVQETADDEIVVFHDSDFMKLANQNLKIWDATRKDLEEIDIGSWFDPQFKDQRVPTLGAVLAACKGKAGVVIELKYYGHDKQLEQRVIDIVEAHDMAGEIEVMSLKPAAVQKMKSLRPEWKTGLLMSVAAGDLKGSGADFLAVNASFADRSFVTSSQKRGQDVYVWTVNDAPTMSMMIGRGVNGLITDHPDLAKVVIAQRAAMTPLQRLLIELAGVLGVTPELGEQ